MGERLLDPSFDNLITYASEEEFNSPFYEQLGTMFLHDQEPLYYTNQRELWQKFKFKRSAFDKRFILVNSELNSPELDEMQRELDVIPAHFFSNGMLAYLWYVPSQFIIVNEVGMIKHGVPRLKHKFSCVNRLISQQRMYRPILSSFLLREIPAADMILSCNLVDPVDNIHAVDSINDSMPDNHRSMLEDLRNEVDPIQINIPPYELGEIPNKSYHWNRDLYRNSFCDIVTETLFYGPTLHLTEKSLRPMVNKRPMILVGPPGSLRYLRSYGFKTFGDFWDESYDDIADANLRLDKIMELIKHINTYPLRDLEEMLAEMEPILEHNWNHFFYSFPRLLIDEVRSNIDQALDEYKTKERGGWIWDSLSGMDEDAFHRRARIEQKIPKQADFDTLYAAHIAGDDKYINNNAMRFAMKYLGANSEVGKQECLSNLRLISS